MRRIGIALFALSFPATAEAQPSAVTDLGRSVIVPQTGVWSPDPAAAVSLEEVRVGVSIDGRIAVTAIDLDVRNHGSTRRVAEVLLPVPQGSAIRGFDFQGASSEPTAKLLDRESARQTFDEIVSRVKDPALLEFASHHVIRSSVFPVEPGSTQRMRITYEQVLPRVGDRVDYELPRSEALTPRSRFRFHAKIRTDAPVAAVYSPTHEIKTVSASEREFSIRVDDDQAGLGPIRVSTVLRGDPRRPDSGGQAVYVHPDPVNDAYTFLALITPPASRAAAVAATREVTLVLDRSGSMKRGALQQVAQAALDVVAGLRTGETFQIVSYNDGVHPFAEQPVPFGDREVMKAKGFLERLKARGGTNIHDALAFALTQPDPGDRLPIVLFLTDGIPTVGRTNESDIVALASASNRWSRRVFTIAAGVDVNAPLLDAVAMTSGGHPTWILPGEDPGRRIEELFARLDAPVVVGPRISFVDDAGVDARHRISEVCPSTLGDIYRDESVVVVGRLHGDEPATLVLSGEHDGRPAKLRVTIDPADASIQDAFVPRIYAARRIAALDDAIRALGADAKTDDVRLRELVDEVVALSTEHGVLTEYTAFLALEGTDLTDRDPIVEEAEHAYRRRAIAVRSGRGGVDQEVARARLRARTVSRPRAEAAGSRADVRQIHDLTFYRRRGLWIDARLVGDARLRQPRNIAFGTRSTGPWPGH